MLRIGFLTNHNPFDKNSFSGTVYYMYRSLSRMHDVEVKVVCEQFHKKRSVVEKILEKVGRLHAGKNQFSPIFDVCRKLNLRRFLKIFHSESDRYSSEFDVLLAPVASNIVGQINAPKNLPPIIFVTDAIYKYINEEYGTPLKADYLANEKKTFDRSARVVFSSEYMLQLAKKHIDGISNSEMNKFTHFPFGLNLDKSLPDVTKSCFGNGLNLVFIGRDWERKGGSVAVDALLYLRAQGYSAHLTIVGAAPSEALQNPNITVYPFVDKNDPDGEKLFFDVLEKGHFLLLPTKADCTPMVIAEANAFGMPALATNVGGIPSLIKHEKNGLMFDPEASGQDYAQSVIALLESEERYQRFVKTSREEFEQRLNWESWAKNIVHNANEILGIT